MKTKGSPWVIFSLILVMVWAIGFRCCETPFGLTQGVDQTPSVMACHGTQNSKTSSDRAPCQCHLSPAHLSFMDFETINIKPFAPLQDLFPYIGRVDSSTLYAHTQALSKQPYPLKEPPSVSRAQLSSIILLI